MIDQTDIDKITAEVARSARSYVRKKQLKEAQKRPAVLQMLSSGSLKVLTIK